MVFFVLLVIPLLVAVGGFIGLKGITWKEFLAQVVIQAIVAGSAAGIVSCQSTADTEVWNGKVVAKRSQHVSCSHSYDCNPYPCNCDKKGNCSTCYHTCYEHSYDVDWDVYTSNAETLAIERVDRQGTSEPPRWSSVQMGEPTAVEHSYVNYIKASPDTLFRRQGVQERFAKYIPKYPDDIYDYYRLNRLVTVGMSLTDAADWNNALSGLNAELGSSKQANIIIMLVKGLGQDFFYGLEEAWIGGKKNDIVLVVGVDDQLAPQWATVMAWTTNELFKIKLRDDVMTAGILTKDKVIAALRQDVSQLFKRKPMHDFEYLKASIVPSTTQWVVSLILSLMVAIGLTWFFHAKDVFGDEGGSSPWRARRRKRAWE